MWSQLYHVQRHHVHWLDRGNHLNAQLSRPFGKGRSRGSGFQKWEVQGYAQRRAGDDSGREAYVEGLVMQSYDRFVGIVARSRNLDEQSLRGGVADGRILSGSDAYAANLVNQLGYVEGAFQARTRAAPGARRSLQAANNSRQPLKDAWSNGSTFNQG